MWAKHFIRAQVKVKKQERKVIGFKVGKKWLINPLKTNRHF